MEPLENKKYAEGEIHMRHDVYLALVPQMRDAAFRYYKYPDYGEPRMLDSQYDQNYLEMEKFENEYPDWIHPLSVVGKVEGGIHEAL